MAKSLRSKGQRKNRAILRETVYRPTELNRSLQIANYANNYLQDSQKHPSLPVPMTIDQLAQQQAEKDLMQDAPQSTDTVGMDVDESAKSHGGRKRDGLLMPQAHVSGKQLKRSNAKVAKLSKVGKRKGMTMSQQRQQVKSEKTFNFYGFNKREKKFF